MCNFAVARGLIAVNPCIGVAMPTTEVARTALLAAASCLPAPYGAFVLTLILTGQRRTEVAAMVWNELDLANRLWVLPKERTKNRLEHCVPLSEPVVSVLTTLPRFTAGDFVFTASAGKAPIRSFHRLKHHLDKLMPPGTERWTLHDVRRSVATGMARLGTQLPVVEKLLNHVSGSFAGIVGVYQRFDFADEKRAAVELWAKHVERLMTGEANVHAR